MKTRQILLILVNSFIFIATAIIATDGFLNGAGNGQVGTYIIGFGYFQPFTMDSNLLAGLSSLVVTIFGIRNLITDQKGTPKWVERFHLMSTTCLFLTILTVAFFLGPMMVAEGKSYFIMFRNDMFFFHFLTPILSILSFTMLQTENQFSKKEFVFGWLPTAVYSVVYFLMVVVFKQWEDFYNFTFGGQYALIPLVFIVMYAISSALALLLIHRHNKRI